MVQYLTKVTEQGFPSLNNFFGEDVLLTINPQVGKGFLRAVQDFCQVAQFTVLVQYFVGVAELLTIDSGTYLHSQTVAEFFQMT